MRKYLLSLLLERENSQIVLISLISELITYLSQKLKSALQLIGNPTKGSSSFGLSQL